MRPRPRLLALLLSATLAAGCGTVRAGTVSELPISTSAVLQHPAQPSARPGPPTVAVPTQRHRVSRGAAVQAALAASATDTDQPCGRIPPAPTGYQHVVWIWLENRSYDTVIGAPGSTASRQAPYLNFLASACGLATNYHNVSHPSQPNYFAAVAGTTGNVTTNCEPSTCSLPNVATLFTQVTGSGRQWRSYEESMPAPCTARNSGQYVDRHNPEVYFPTDGRQCQAWDLPMGSTSHGALVDALNSNSLPAFSFVTPNVCTDMHSCPTGAGDAWLSRWVPRIIDSPGYRDGTTAVFITFDEGEGGHTYDCATNSSDVGCHVATVVVSPSTPQGTRSGQLFNHYGLLKTTELLLGLPALLGHAADPGTASMVSAFGL
ncbi:MAG: phosphatidylinositol-3-phosphatase [Frankiales bacterium]|nr:phosphatidylinositol-3-phosphatase [Frankiales bacterium]